MSTVLKMEHIEKVYGNQVRALTDINLEVSEGEFVAIIGPSGSGKSTLLRTINQLVVPSGGQVYIDGEEVTGASGKKLRLLRRKVGMIFQHVGNGWDAGQLYGSGQAKGDRAAAGDRDGGPFI